MKNLTQVITIGILGLASLVGCSRDRFYVGAYNPTRRKINEREQAELNKEYIDWYERNKDLPPEERSPYTLPLFRYKVR